MHSGRLVKLTLLTLSKDVLRQRRQDQVASSSLSVSFFSLEKTRRKYTDERQIIEEFAELRLELGGPDFAKASSF